MNLSLANSSFLSTPAFKPFNLQSLMTLNSCLIQSMNVLLSDKTCNGSLLSVMTQEQTQNLLKKIETSPQINRRLEAYSQLYNPTPSQKLPKRSAYEFEDGVFKKVKVSEEKEVLLSETKSEVSTECDLSTVGRQDSFDSFSNEKTLVVKPKKISQKKTKKTPKITA